MIGRSSALVNSFEYIEKLWGPHTVDCFSNYYNKKVDIFFSQLWNPNINSSGAEIFLQDAGNENCLVVLPITMITKAIYYLYASRAVGAVTVPFWQSGYSWPVITRMYRDYFTGYEVFTGKWALPTAGTQIHC